MRTDYHLHCEFSDDSRETMDSQIKRAIELGLDEICFTDHVDYGIKKDWDEGDILWRGGDGIGIRALVAKHVHRHNGILLKMMVKSCPAQARSPSPNKKNDTRYNAR